MISNFCMYTTTAPVLVPFTRDLDRLVNMGPVSNHIRGYVCATSDAT